MIETSPWYSLYKFAPPHFPFCGDMHEGWILDPIDTYTSAFYLISSLFILREAKNSPPILKTIGIIPLFVTVGSVLFHMSFTYTFLVADFLGIFYLNFYGIFLNFVRLGKFPVSKVASYSLFGTAFYGVLMAVTYKFNIHSGLLMLPLSVIYIGSEIICRQREKETSYAPYWMAFFLIVLGYMAMLVEGPPYRLGCLEDSYKGKIQLHSLWHLLSATSMIFIFRFYNQQSIRRSLVNLPEEPQN